MYTANYFSGNLVEDNDEGRLFFLDYNEFIGLDNKSDSMDDILSIYHGQYSEIDLYYRGNKIVERKKYK